MRFGNSRYWLFQACGWGAFILIHLFFTWSFDKMQTAKDRSLFFGQIGIFILLGVLITHIMRIVIIRINLLQKRLEKQIWQFILLTSFFAFIGSYFDILLLRKFELLTKGQEEMIDKKNLFMLILSNAFSVFIYYFIWNVIYFMYHYIRKSQKQQLDTLQLESLVKALELKTIKAHINPHFIFNSLNSIRALVDENPQRAREAVTELSNILRSSMYTEKMETVNFEKELDIVKDYLALENMRFEDRLKIEYQIDEDTLDQPVPPMMLQTLVENAIKHGISKQVNGGVVKIISDFKGNYHEMAVQNTGNLNGYLNTEAHPDDPFGKGFGLSSTTNRLSLLYGDKAMFEIKQMTPSLVEAKVLIPISAF
ncbi:MAG: histidine kinase [Bacteroidia bacterium]|nr:histidine kinase [Bacteroidia bacterium]